MSLLSLLFLYLCFRAKQCLCDFVLQTDGMVQAKQLPGMQGHRALMTHCLIHGAGTTAIMLVFAPQLWWLGFIDIAIHGAIDRIKIIITARANLGIKDSLYWVLFGIDQEAHNLTHLAYIIVVIMQAGLVV